MKNTKQIQVQNNAMLSFNEYQCSRINVLNLSIHVILNILNVFLLNTLIYIRKLVVSLLAILCDLRGDAASAQTLSLRR